ncbi:patatin-like phospholipase family protein [Oceanimonas sp. CHS3-5]|uniref:patatin-like phospholipase family protein n=1 Tax=Oceanimonas sp. CHS3-5 TaxID=3068186 RepID=UPI00273FBF04|nr:patatin-like phospholipase family protein [Oceanimonas sp. CHS3-5]MDP5291633.1 patatin-like phospholipase family protein [Oceanimonas sp. CHS3-5]
MEREASNACALVMTGGGARAAYQVGVLKAIAECYPRGHAIPFPILCGTSAGAINATALACYASCFHLGVRKLEYVWRHLRTHKVLQLQLGNIASHSVKSLVKGMLGKPTQMAMPLFDNSPLERLLETLIDFQRIDNNLLYGALEVLAVTASNYNTGDSTTFFQGRPYHQPWARAGRSGRSSIIATPHLMASSALPFVFKPCRLQNHFYGDGSIHQLNPLSPAIHLGASRILIISLAHDEQEAGQLSSNPSSSDIAGHLLDTIFTDALTSDIERLQRINSTIRLVPERRREQLSLRHIDNLVLKPSKNLDELTLRHFNRLPWNIRTLLRLFGVEAGDATGLASFLLFEQEYTRELIDLGYTDTKARLEEVCLFLGLDVELRKTG